MRPPKNDRRGHVLPASPRRRGDEARGATKARRGQTERSVTHTEHPERT